MKQIPKKNYIILVVLLAVTVFFTLFLSNIYKNKEKLTSNFYEYSNKITPESFDEFMTENEDIIIYIGDKYDLTLETVEKKLEERIDQLNLKHNFIYIDKHYVDKKFIKKLKGYHINIDLNKLPVFIVIVEEEVIKNVMVNSNTDIDALIDSEAFE
ncbi:MAG: hypothetical protein IJE04_04615 [Bacilli bacterium]|nr:hypothetical protein [Bacilli bacterium]